MASAITDRPMKWMYVDQNRIGDHICYYSDLGKMKSHYPSWDITKSLPQIFEQIATGQAERRRMPATG
jgi:CDP-paratose 2-epimerase